MQFCDNSTCSGYCPDCTVSQKECAITRLPCEVLLRVRAWLQGQPSGTHAAAVPLADIQQTLEEERAAVATFLHTCIDQVLLATRPTCNMICD